MQNKQNSANSMIDQLSSYTPIILFVTMLLLFGIVGIIQNQFYSELFTTAMPERAGFIGLTIPVVIQTLRLTSGLLSASFFKSRRFFLGVMVFAFSIWLSMFEHNEVKHMAEIWGNVTLLESESTLLPMMERKVELSTNALTKVMRVMIWSALVLELFLAFWLSGKKEEKQKDFLNDFSSNGEAKRKKEEAFQ